MLLIQYANSCSTILSLVIAYWFDLIDGDCKVKGQEFFVSEDAASTGFAVRRLVSHRFLEVWTN
jgi:hypothetical protein